MSAAIEACGHVISSWGGPEDLAWLADVGFEKQTRRDEHTLTVGRPGAPGAYVVRVSFGADEPRCEVRVDSAEAAVLGRVTPVLDRYVRENFAPGAEFYVDGHERIGNFRELSIRQTRRTGEAGSSEVVAFEHR